MKKKVKKEKFLNPGSDAAILKGCKCAVLDNAHGIGYGGVPGSFSVDGGCPMHRHMMKDGKSKR